MKIWKRKEYYQRRNEEEIDQNFNLSTGEIEHQKFATLSSYNPRFTGKHRLRTCNEVSVPCKRNGNQQINIVNKTAKMTPKTSNVAFLFFRLIISFHRYLKK